MHEFTPNLLKRVNSDLTPDNGIDSTAQTVRTPGNSVGVAITLPKVEVQSYFTLVNDIGSTAQTVRTPGNSVGVAIS